MNPAEVNVVLPDPEPHGEDGRLGLRALLLVRYGVPPQVGPTTPVAHRLKEKQAFNTDVPAYSDTVYSDTPLTATLLAGPT